ncbi:unnamed protein product [Brassica oleracea]
MNRNVRKYECWFNYFVCFAKVAKKNICFTRKMMKTKEKLHYIQWLAMRDGRETTHMLYDYDDL